MVILPGSKSMAARLLILDYIRGERSVRGGLPECDDTQFLAKAMQDLCRQPSGGNFYLGSGATSLRFFVALVASLEGFEGEIEVSPNSNLIPCYYKLNLFVGSP